MNRAALWCVGFPIVVLAGWVGRLAWAEHNGTVVQLAVRGFDPRDLLAGHYLTYTVDYGTLEVCSSEHFDEQAEKCVCLVPGQSQNHEASWVGACSERAESCDVFIKGACRYNRFEADIERFYIPEEFESELAIVPERSAIRVVLRPSGDGLVTGFTVDGVDVLEYAKTRANER